MTPSVKITVSERNGRHCASTGSAWEAAIGYSRAIRAGDLIAVTGTVGIEADGRFAPTIKGQTRRPWRSSSPPSRPWEGKPSTWSAPESS